MAVINGAKSVDEVAKTVKAGFGKVIRVRSPTSSLCGDGAARGNGANFRAFVRALQITWMTSPVYTVFAQQFLPAEMWVPFFNFMQFLTGVSRSSWVAVITY